MRDPVELCFIGFIDMAFVGFFAMFLRSGIAIFRANGRITVSDGGLGMRYVDPPQGRKISVKGQKIVALIFMLVGGVGMSVFALDFVRFLLFGNG